MKSPRSWIRQETLDPFRRLPVGRCTANRFAGGGSPPRKAQASHARRRPARGRLVVFALLVGLMPCLVDRADAQPCDLEALGPVVCENAKLTGTLWVAGEESKVTCLVEPFGMVHASAGGTTTGADNEFFAGLFLAPGEKCGLLSDVAAGVLFGGPDADRIQKSGKLKNECVFHFADGGLETAPGVTNLGGSLSGTWKFDPKTEIPKVVSGLVAAHSVIDDSGVSVRFSGRLRAKECSPVLD